MRHTLYTVNTFVNMRPCFTHGVILVGLCMFAIYTLTFLQMISIYNKQQSTQHVVNETRAIVNVNVASRSNQRTQFEQNKPLFVLGILSEEKNQIRRKLLRETTLHHIKEARNDIPYVVEYRFIMDSETPTSAFEQNCFNDIFYLNATDHGWANNFGYKAQLWFKYVMEHFPDFSIAAKMDDDVYICVPHIFTRIFELHSPTLYYGWKNGKLSDTTLKQDNNVDGMFVVLGRLLVERISKRKYCNGPNCGRNDLIDVNHDGLSIIEWISQYRDVVFKADNKRIVFNWGKENWDNEKLTEKYIKPDFCERYLLYHKANFGVMRLLDLYNKNINKGFNNRGEVDFNSKSVTGFALTGDRMREIPAFFFNWTQFSNNMINYPDTLASCSQWAVVTTIFKPFEVFTLIRSRKDWCVVVVAGVKSVSRNRYLARRVKGSHVVYLSLNDQEEQFPLMASYLPLNNIGRKNIGYVYAIQHGAKYIWDFDNDIIGYIDFEKMKMESMESKIAIYQSLANLQPDVDALFRLKRKTPVFFKSNHSSHGHHVIPNKIFTPFNAQATLWTKQSFLYLSLPISMNGRVSDIWRSYIAQFFLNKFEIGHLAFTPPFVVQKRNYHDIIRDFQAEHPLYLQSQKFIELLTGEDAFKNYNNLKDVYLDLYRRKYIEIEDLHFIMAWQTTMDKINNI